MLDEEAKPFLALAQLFLILAASIDFTFEHTEAAAQTLGLVNLVIYSQRHGSSRDKTRA